MNFTDSFDPVAFRDMVYSFRQSRIILTAYELELFSALGQGSLSSADVCEKLGTHSGATSRLMNALCAIGLLVKEGEQYSNSGFAAKFLSKSSPDYLNGFGHTLNMWNTWTGLTHAVRTGHNQRTGQGWSQGKARAFIAAMHERATRQAPDVVKRTGIGNAGHMLDLGGGSGAYSMEFIRQGIARRATVFDLPEIIPITRHYVETMGMSKEFEFIAGDFHTDDPGSGYGLVFLSAIVHINSPEENRALLRKCFHCLEPGGKILIQDHIISNDRTSPAESAFFSINMLVATDNGDTYTAKEMTEWLLDAGFVGISIQETPNNGLISGIKACVDQQW